MFWVSYICNRHNSTGLVIVRIRLSASHLGISTTQNWKESIRSSQQSKANFASTETEAVFILAAHLPGFTKDEIEVAANEEEKQISIRGGGRIACQEAVITRRVAITREVLVERFDESFPVPESVDWDGIDAWFDEEEKNLFISIPKLLMNECPWIREEETAEHLNQEGQRVETQEPTEEEKNGKSKLMRPYKGKEKLKEMSGDSLQPSPAEQLQPGTTGVEGPDQVLEAELIESKQEYEDIQIEKNREIKREKPEVKTADEVTIEAELIESEEGRMELPPKESDEEINEKPMAAEWPEIRKSEIELEGTKDEEPQLTGSEIDRRASIETKEGYQNVPQKEAKIKQCHEKPTEKPSLLIKEEAKQRKSEEQAEKGMHQPEEEWAQENKNLTEGLPQEKPKTEKLSEPMEPHQKNGESQLEITDQVMEAKRPTKSQEKEEEMQKQEQEHRELEQLLHGFKDDEDRQLKVPDEEPFRARESLKSKELSLDLYKQKTEKLTLKAPKEMQEAAEPTKTEKEAKVKPQLQQSQEQEVNERKTPIEVLSYEKMRTTKIQVPKEPDKELKQYEHEVKEDGKPIEEPTCEMPKAVELPHKEELKPKAHKLHEDEDHQWMGHVKEVSKTRMPQDLEEKYKTFQQDEEYIKQKAKKPTEIAHKLFEVAGSRKFEAAKKDVEQPEEQEQENKTIIQPPREKVSAKKPSEPNEKVGVKEPDQTQNAGLILSEDIKEELQQHDDGVKKHDEFIVVPTYEKPDTAGLKQHEQEVQVHEKPIIAPTCEKPPVTTPDQGLGDEEHYQPEQLVKEFQQSKEELQKKEKLAIVPTSEKSKAAEYSRKEEFQEDINHQRKGPDVKTSATKKFLKLEEESQLLQQEQEIMKKEAQKPTMRENKRLVEAIEPKQSEKEIQELVDEESFKREIILKSPEKFPEQIKPEKEVQKHKLVIQMEESMIPRQKLLQPEEDEMQTAQDFFILKKPETEAVKEKQHSEQTQESKHQKPAEDSSYLASKTTKLMGLEKQESQDKKSPVQRRPEPGKTKETEEQREQLGKKPTNQEATTLLVSEEEKNKIAIAKMLEIERMPELQEPYKKPEKSLSVESKMQLKPTQKVEAKERVFPLGAELPDKQAIETSKPESQTKESKVTESSIPHAESKEHHKTAVGAPYQTLDMTEFKAPEEQERTTPKKPDTKETPERQQRYQQKESKEVEKPVANKIKESRSLKEKEQELQAQQKEEDKTKSHEPHQSKEKTERLKELQSVMPTYNDEKEREIPQLADEEIQQLKSPEQFPQVIKPEKEAQKSMLVKEIDESEMPKQKCIQLEEKEAPTPQAVLKTHQPEPSHESKHQKPYKMTEGTLHVEEELQLKLPNEIEAQETLRPAVGAQLPDKLEVKPSERESQNVQQATESLMPLLQPFESKQRKQLERPSIRLLMEEVSKQKPEQQLNQPEEEEAHKRESPMQKLARNGAILEPPDSAERTNALMEQELYRYEGKHAQDIESPTLLKPRPFPSKHKDRKVLEHDDTAVEPPKPLPIIRVMMETDRSPHLLTMEKKATENTISPPRIRGAVEPEGLPLQPSPYDKGIKREFPALIQKELHTYSDIQKPQKEETVSRQMPEFEEAASEQGGKTKEQPAPYVAKIEIERPAEEVPHNIFESPQQEENPPSPFDDEIKTLEVPGDDSEASGVEMEKTTKLKKLSKERHIHCRCHGRRPAFPIPPSTLLSGSAFVFSMMVLVFHFIKRKKSN